MTMGDRVAVMREGRLEQLDAPHALYDRPANLFVTAFIGSPAMNLLRGRIEEVGDRVEAVLGDQPLDLPGEPPTARGEVAFGIRPEAVFVGGGGR
jgi:multiple sugar transport system ATP-binding protein